MQENVIIFNVVVLHSLTFSLLSFLQKIDGSVMEKDVEEDDSSEEETMAAGEFSAFRKTHLF